jgi:hypothetical protein
MNNKHVFVVNLNKNKRYSNKSINKSNVQIKKYFFLERYATVPVMY